MSILHVLVLKVQPRADALTMLDPRSHAGTATSCELILTEELLGSFKLCCRSVYRLTSQGKRNTIQ
eukprot:1985335-Amphidinium_carterae.2